MGYNAPLFVLVRQGEATRIRDRAIQVGPAGRGRSTMPPGTASSAEREPDLPARGSMNVLHTDFHQGWGGQAARVLMVCRALREKGHRMTIAAPPGELTRRAREADVAVDDGFSFRPPAHALSF